MTDKRVDPYAKATTVLEMAHRHIIGASDLHDDYWGNGLPRDPDLGLFIKATELGHISMDNTCWGTVERVTKALDAIRINVGRQLHGCYVSPKGWTYPTWTLELLRHPKSLPITAHQLGQIGQMLIAVSDGEFRYRLIHEGDVIAEGGNCQ